MNGWVLYGRSVKSRLLLGTAQYPSPAILQQAAAGSGADILTVSLRRESAGSHSGQAFAQWLQALPVQILPNTAGCHSVKEAVTTAHMARELYDTTWLKLEVIADDNSLCPDVFGLVEACRILVAEGFKVFPYTTADLGVADRLLEAGCEVLMPWAAPIGTARGPGDLYALRALRAHAPGVPLIVDAGLGLPSHAAAVMELGYDGVLLNTAVARAGDPVAMAAAFALAVDAGHRAWCAQPISPRDMAVPSTPSWGLAQLA
ncbi:thiazole synthase [Frateuria aurantia]